MAGAKLNPPVRLTNSAASSGYARATGGNKLSFGRGASLVIDDIDLRGATSIKIFFGITNESGEGLTTIPGFELSYAANDSEEFVQIIDSGEVTQTPTGGWNEYNITSLDMPEGTTSIRLKLENNGAIRYFVDDLYVDEYNSGL